MDARIHLTEETRYQESTITKILKWMQEHPKACRNTTITRMARMMAKEFSSYQTIYRHAISLVKDGTIQRVGNKYNSNFSINYLSNKVAPTVRSEATTEEKERIKEMLDRVIEQSNISPDGCIVRKEEIEEVEPTEINTENKMMVPVVINKETTDDEKKISITITINLSI